ncbi:MAG: squalene/phytoene synthase family protein [Hyphomicrobiaceae bacterium]|nr:squalene/phytoene synthase family protein [Hyphomicrobiaceae bacterium]
MSDLGAELKEQDFDAYAASLFVPETAREAFQALALFRTETARIAPLVAEPLVGEIRLQWWREVVEGEREAEAAHVPLAAALTRVVASVPPARAALAQLCEARIGELYHDPMPDMPSFEAYAGETEGAILQLQALVLTPQQAPALAEAAGHASLVLSLARGLANLPADARRSVTLLPASDALTRAALLAGTGEKADAEARRLARAGLDHAVMMRKALTGIPKSALAPFLPVRTALAILGRVEAGGMAAIRQGAAGGRLSRLARITFCALSGRL